MTLLLMLLCLQEGGGDLQSLSTRIEKNPKDVRAYLDRARLYGNKGDPESALRDLDKAVTLDPDNGQIYIQRGMIRMGLHDRSGAFADWDKAVKLNPKLKSRVQDLRNPRRKSEKGTRRFEDRGQDSRAHGNRRVPKILRPEQVKAKLEILRSFLEREDPERLRRLRRAVDRGDAREASRVIEEVERQKEQLDRMKKHDPERYRLHVQMRELDRGCRDLANKIRRNSRAKDVSVWKKELAQKLSDLFDLREQRRARDVEELRRRLEKLEAILQKRKESKDRIVERRMKKMTGEQDLEEW